MRNLVVVVAVLFVANMYGQEFDVAAPNGLVWIGPPIDPRGTTSEHSVRIIENVSEQILPIHHLALETRLVLVEKPKDSCYLGGRQRPYLGPRNDQGDPLPPNKSKWRKDMTSRPKPQLNRSINPSV